MEDIGWVIDKVILYNIVPQDFLSCLAATENQQANIWVVLQISAENFVDRTSCYDLSIAIHEN